MARPATPANTRTGDSHNDRLRTLVTRIAAGDRAFRTVYAFLAMRVWRDALRLLPPADARAVPRSTFVEMWHFAGHHRVTIRRVPVEISVVEQRYQVHRPRGHQPGRRSTDAR